MSAAAAIACASQSLGKFGCCVAIMHRHMSRQQGVRFRAALAGDFRVGANACHRDHNPMCRAAALVFFLLLHVDHQPYCCMHTNGVLALLGHGLHHAGYDSCASGQSDASRYYRQRSSCVGCEAGEQVT